MSDGQLCDCPQRDHTLPSWWASVRDPLGLEKGACRRYAARHGRCRHCWTIETTSGGSHADDHVDMSTFASSAQLDMEDRARELGLSTPEPDPIPSEAPAIWNLVVNDMDDRDISGRLKYGTPLQPFNGRDALKDAYQEALDLVVYLRQALYERDGR